jgi:hypothetical protein
MRSNLATLTSMTWIPVLEWQSGLMVMSRAPSGHRPSRVVHVREWSDEPGFPVAIRGQMIPKNSRLRLYF